MTRTSWPMVLCAALGAWTMACGESLPTVELALAKNCTEAEVVTLVPRVGDGTGTEVLDVAADGPTGETAWVALRRPSATGGSEVVVQRVSAAGVEHEVLLPIESSGVSLQPAPETGRVWVVREDFGELQLWRLTPDDPVRPVVGSSDLSSFPSANACLGCDELPWPRRLIFLPTGPALVSMPRSSTDAALVVWVGTLDTNGAEVRLDREHRLNFEPPCDGLTPEEEVLCEQERDDLQYPEISLLGVQQDPRQPQTVLFGHRTRVQIYDGQEFPLESADVFMVAVFEEDDGTPAGVLRSYTGFYDGPSRPGEVPPLPTADPPYGLAIDRFASYGLFSNGGVLARLIVLPNDTPDFTELSARVVLPLDVALMQLDRDLAMGRVVDGAWEITKLFPDDPAQSKTLRHEADAPITAVASGGLGTFLLRKQGKPPEVVRVQCSVLPVDASEEG